MNSGYKTAQKYMPNLEALLLTKEKLPQKRIEKLHGNSSINKSRNVFDSLVTRWPRIPTELELKAMSPAVRAYTIDDIGRQVISFGCWRVGVSPDRVISELFSTEAEWHEFLAEVMSGEITRDWSLMQVKLLAERCRWNTGIKERERFTGKKYQFINMSEDDWGNIDKNMV